MGRNPRKTRGEYRPIYEALFYGKDYRALSPDAKLVLLTLKGTCGAIGMKAWPALIESLSEMTGMPTPRIKKAMTDLGAAQWVEYEDGIVWVVRGLEFEPQISRGEKHQAWFNVTIDTLPRAPIVSRLRAHYAPMFGLPDTLSDRLSDRVSGRPSHSPPEGHGIPVPVPVPVPNPVPVRSPQSNAETDNGLADDAQLLTIAANAGISARYGEQPNPIHHGHAGGITCAERLRKVGVDLEFAHVVIFAYASTMTRERPPRSLGYFTEHVIERWHAEQAKRAAAGYRPSGERAPEMDQMHSAAVRYARAGSAEWQQYCDTRKISWREDAAA